MKELKEKAQALVDKYTPELAENGIKILVSKRYFEEAVQERSGTMGTGGILDTIDRARDRKKEIKKGYNYERNKYHSLVISVIPSGKNVLRREDCKDYAFVIRRVWRAHVGQEPNRVAYEEEKVLSKIEKRILKILKKAEKTSAEKVCKDNVFDALRYTHGAKYGYKGRFLGKEKYTWDLIFGVFVGVIALAVIFILWLVGLLRG